MLPGLPLPKALLGPIRSLTVHCTATPEGRADSARKICEMDIARPDLRQIAYHFVVELDGTLVQCLPERLRGAHVGGHNTGNIGVAYVGGMSKDMKRAKDTRTPAQRATIKRLVTEYRSRFPSLRVLGHRDWPGVAKACPCYDVAVDMLSWRA